jgi:hypothetical protein
MNHSSNQIPAASFTNLVGSKQASRSTSSRCTPASNQLNKHTARHTRTHCSKHAGSGRYLAWLWQWTRRRGASRRVRQHVGGPQSCRSGRSPVPRRAEPLPPSPHHPRAWPPPPPRPVPHRAAAAAAGEATLVPRAVPAPGGRGRRAWPSRHRAGSRRTMPRREPPPRAGSRRRRLACPRAGLSSPRARSRRAGPRAQVAAAASSIRREPSRRLFCLTGWAGDIFLGFSGEPFLSHRGIGRGPTRQTQVDNASGLSCRCKWEGHRPMTIGPRELGPTRQ